MNSTEDHRYYRLDTAKENAKFLLQLYTHEQAVKYVADSLLMVQDNPIATEYWQKVHEELEKIE